MGTKKAKVIIFVLLLIVLLCGVACGRQGNSLASLKNGENITQSATASDKLTPVVIQKEAVALPENGYSVAEAVYVCDYVYIRAEKDGEQAFYRYDIASGNVEKLGIDYGDKAERFSADENGIIYILRTAEDGVTYIDRVAQGEAVVSVPVDSRLTETTSIKAFTPFGTGYLVDNYKQLAAVDHDGNLLTVLGKCEYGASILRLSADKALLIYSGTIKSDTSALEARPTHIDLIDSAYNILASVDLTGGYASFFPGVNETAYATIGTSYYSYDITSGALTEKYDITANNDEPPVCALDEDRFFALERGQPLIWTVAPDTGSHQLVLAGYNLDATLLSAVQRYNDSNRGYRITVNDYAKYDEYNSLNAGLARYSAEVTAGNTPDIYDLSYFSTQQYAAKGLLENLLPYMDADTDLTRDTFYKAVDLSAYRGGVYELVPAFSVLSLAGSADIVPVPFTVADFTALAEIYTPEQLFGTDMTKSEFLKYALMFNKEEVYSTENVHCNFTAETFGDILSFAKRLPDEKSENSGTPYTRALQGEQLMLIELMGPYFVDFLSYYNTFFGEDSVTTGLPSAAGSGCAFVPQMPLGMSSSSAYKDGVWDFFKFLMSESVQRELFTRMYLPSNKAVLQETVDSYVAAYVKQPMKLYNVGRDMETVEIQGSMSGEKAESAASAFIDGVDTYGVYEKEILNIIIDAAGAFFAGDKTVEDTLTVIQSRVSIYLAEQYG